MEMGHSRHFYQFEVIAAGPENMVSITALLGCELETFLIVEDAQLNAEVGHITEEFAVTGIGDAYAHGVNGHFGISRGLHIGYGKSHTVLYAEHTIVIQYLEFGYVGAVNLEFSFSARGNGAKTAEQQ